MDPISRRRAFLLWTSLILVFALVVFFVRLAADEVRKDHFRYSDGLDRFGGLALWSVVGAFTIGALGAAAFLLAVSTEIIQHTATNKVRDVARNAATASIYAF